MEAKEHIKQSEKRLNKLKVISNFFDQSKVVAILVRTKVIHDVFNSNSSLDTNKLELFHLQYTDSLLQLLIKLKKKIELKYAVYTNEIQINKTILNELENEIVNEDFFVKVKSHNAIMQKVIEYWYDELAYNKNNKKPIEIERINTLSNEMGIEFYRKITINDYEKLNAISTSLYYEILDYRIEKKLLGQLNNQKFKFKFLCGFQFNNEFIEVYEFINVNEYFMFLKEKKEFLIMHPKSFSNICFSKNVSNKKEIILELKSKNIDLISKAENSLKQIPNDVQIVLNDYFSKISSIEFLDELQCIDEQTNILRTMLNINIK